MSNILSQEEINALLQGTLDEESPEDGGAKSSKENVVSHTHQRILKYDFKRPNVFPKEHMRTIQSYHENFARLFGASLAIFLRQDLKFHLTYIEQHIYSEFIEESDENSIFYIVSFLNDQGIISLNKDMAFLIIEKLLGGAGEDIKIERNDFTEIELSILKQLFERMFTSLKTCWEPLMTEAPQIIAVEYNAKLIHLLPQNDPILKLVFELTIGENIGLITMCLPYVAVEPYMDRIVSHQNLRQKKESENKEKELKKLLNKVRVPLTAVLGNSTLSIGEINNLASGDIIKLNQRTSMPTALKVGPLNKFEGEVGTYEKHLAIKILNVQEIENETLEEKLLAGAASS